MPKKLKQDGKPEVHKDLKGFNISVDDFGKVSVPMEMDKVYLFLNSQGHRDIIKEEEE